jgi:hypothetical protein
MNKGSFKFQMDRLSRRFGEKYYLDDFLKLLWREISHFTDQWMEITVDEFIGCERQPPLMPEFRKKISESRERNWSQEKQEHKEEAKEFVSMFQKEDIQQVVEHTVNKLKGRITQDQFDSMCRGLAKITSSMNGYKCQSCCDTGVRNCTEEEGHGVITCSCRIQKRGY